MERNEKAVALLERAVELMNDEGRHWAKGAYSRVMRDGSMSYCSVGAVWQAGSDLHCHYGVTDVALRELAKTIMPGEPRATSTGIVINFNDLKAKEWEDVKDVFSRTISRLKGVTA